MEGKVLKPTLHHIINQWDRHGCSHQKNDDEPKVKQCQQMLNRCPQHLPYTYFFCFALHNKKTHTVKPKTSYYDTNHRKHRSIPGSSFDKGPPLLDRAKFAVDRHVVADIHMNHHTLIPIHLDGRRRRRSKMGELFIQLTIHELVSVKLSASTC